MFNRVRVSRQASMRLFAILLCSSLVFSAFPVTPNRGRSSAQSNPAGLRTTGAPSPNLPDLDAVRDKKEPEHKMSAPAAAKRCRHWDRKCKDLREKGRSSNETGESDIDNVAGAGWTASGENAFDWRSGPMPFGNLFGKFRAPADLQNRASGSGLRASREIRSGSADRGQSLPRAFANSLFPATAATFQYANLETARVQPQYRTGQSGEDLLSGNFHWSTPIVSLPGRAGHDLNLTLSYNSLVWTKSGGAIRFDMDYGWPSPGFRFGFPVFYGPYVNSRTKVAYLP